MNIDIIIFFIKLFVMNNWVYYVFVKITNKKPLKINNFLILFIFNVILTFTCTYIEFYLDSFLSVIILCVLYAVILSKLTREKLGYSLIVTLISYAITIVCLGFSAIICYIFYRIFVIKNKYLNLLIILIFQAVFIYFFLKSNKFKNGFDYISQKMNNDVTDLITINISIAVIFAYCLLGTVFEELEQIRIRLFISFLFLTFTLIIMIHKNLTLYYKQKLLKTTVNSYKEKIEEKELEINKLKDEKYKISKIVHEFYNRQEALEQAVKDEEFRKRIKNLTTEFSNEFEKIKTLDKLEETEIAEIDDMFKYMQKECDKNNIKFHLKIEGNIHYLINNIIPKNKLETLIGDHIRDAINAVKSSNEENREILVILGKKDENYELTIFDTGIEFEIDTLLKLGKERVTTYKNKGGNGIGFMTTFETMKETGASLIIEEFQPNKDRFYTKSVTIKFDGKNQYKVISYRQNLLVK